MFVIVIFTLSVGGVFFIFAIMAGCLSSGAKNGWLSNIFDVAPNHTGIVTAITCAVMTHITTQILLIIFVLYPYSSSYLRLI